jgi:pimeloyl-ACP methyl ester carboxylesterase
MTQGALAWVAAVLLLLVASLAIWGGAALFWAVAALAALYALGRRLFADERRPDEIHYTHAADGWDLAIWRYRPRGAERRNCPVLLVHGLGANQRNFDLDDRCSVALFLARAGYDCYLPALRGGGPSAYRRWGYPDKWNITFDKYADLDLPAAFAKVRELAGAPHVHVIGHSMGAMLGYAIAEGELGAQMKSLTAVSGPCFFEHMQQFAPVLKFRRLLNPFVVLHTTVGAAVQSVFVRLWPRLAGRQEVNPDNVDGATVARAAVNLIANIPRDLLFQFAKWIGDREFGSHRPESWQKGLPKITTPIYCLGGPDDYFCRPAANEKVIDFVGSAKKKYRLFSKANGDRADYGHGDIVIGRTAPDDVFPTILEWVNEND